MLEENKFDENACFPFVRTTLYARSLHDKFSTLKLTTWNETQNGTAAQLAIHHPTVDAFRNVSKNAQQSSSVSILCWTEDEWRMDAQGLR